MSEWTKISVKKEHVATAYAEAVSQSRVFNEGVHSACTIVSVAPIKDYPGIDVEWENVEGARKRQRIFATSKAFDSDDVIFSKPYIWFAKAVCGDDMELYQEFFLVLAQTTPAILNNLKGIKANIRIGWPKKGITIKRNEGNSSLSFFDLEFNTVLEEHGAHPTFESCRDYAKEHGIRLRFQEVLAVYTNKDHNDANRERLRDAIKVHNKTSGAPAVKPQAVQGF